MKDDDFKNRVPDLEQINRTNVNLTQGGFNQSDEGEGQQQKRSWFDEKGAARRQHIDDIAPEDER